MGPTIRTYVYGSASMLRIFSSQSGIQTFCFECFYFGLWNTVIPASLNSWLTTVQEENQHQYRSIPHHFMTFCS